ncbi:DEAD/DEAH box helicase [Alkalicella caledoniensis]|uniref:DNA 5'-3' helicase n=1 Tax=Alkalicella caledoniensis TaxID=2731377 RepID=A0A7G9W8V0_ALKCA|nr:helicase C-terminal domain-containing protein [Alkalicella caledoniensis]QNO15112.1 DEAD/DEAH box helicase [Alkalicella caledoniensis]
MTVSFREDVKNRIRLAIEKAGGNEVFFRGVVNDSKEIFDMEILARGNEFSVPAIMYDLEVGDVVIHNHPSGNLSPSQADIGIAAKLGQDGIGFIIVSNNGERSYTVVEPMAPQEQVDVSEENIEEILGPVGVIAQTLENYEQRPEQLSMSKLIAKGLNQSQHVIVEAGTGTGKSLAYLIPGILWAVGNKKRVVVSTNTINLQEQIVYKDIPFLQKVLPLGFKGVLVKGRSNYLCLRKLENIETDSLLEDIDEDYQELKLLKDWGLKTKEGSKADLNFMPRESNWEQVCSEGDLCLKLHCSNYRECFFFKARRESANADILVVNHHLLFADISLKAKGLEGGVLPSYHSVVFDEAHNIEDTATQYFGYKANKYLVPKQLNRLFYSKGGKQKGFLMDISQKLTNNKYVTPLLKQKVYDEVHMYFLPQIADIVSKNNYFFDNIYLFLDGNTSKLRLTQEVVETQPYKKIKEEVFQFLKIFSEFIERVRALQKELEDMAPKAFESFVPNMVELSAMITRLESIVETLDYIFLKETSEDVKWLELSGTQKNRYITAYSAPLDVSKALYQNIYDNYESVVLTSATMTTGGNFKYIKDRVGLGFCEDKLEELTLPSPFDYRQQVLFCVPTDISEPTMKNFNQDIPNVLLKTILATGGRAFVLFTSFKMLSDVYNELKPILESRGINCLKQGEYQRHILLQNFKKDVTSVLFATASFWEGVDVQGEALSNVILVKLPFSVPDEPIIEARQELIAKGGGNPFMEYTVPQAVLKFKQGFGRLIRSKSDKGVVVVTDKRVLTKQYGKIFLKSLPRCKEFAGSTEAIAEKIREFI